MHHLRHDRPSISPTYAHKCSHGHMYLVLETFIRAESPARLSGGWSRIVRQLSDAPPQARSTVDLPPYAHKCSHGHMYLVLDTFIRTKSAARLSGGGAELYDNSLMHHLRRDRPSISTPYAQKCSHGHMYLVLDTFIRTKSAARLSGDWSRIVRQLSDAPPQARSTVHLRSIRTKMFPRTHVPCARHLHPCRIARSAKLQAEPNCTTTL